MKLELKKVKIVEELSEETQCFSADLWVDGKKVAHVSNRGHGGCDMHHPYEGQREKLNEVFEYCKTLPKVKFRDTFMDNDIELVVSKLLSEHQTRKSQGRKLIYEDKDEVVWHVGWKGLTIKKMLETEQGRARLKNQIWKIQKDGGRVLNTNLGVIYPLK